MTRMIQSPIFVISTQRSGSTLFTRMLSARDDFFVQNDMGTWGVFDGKYDQQILINRILSKMQEHFGVDTTAIENGKLSWGWKEPLLTPFLPDMQKYFPNSKYLLLIRDPRAVVSSYIENRWGLGTTAYTGALRWRDEVSQQLAFADQPDIDCLTVHYEQLITDPESELQRVCKFLELPYNENMLQYHKDPLQFAQNKSNKNTLNAPDITKLSNWRNKLSSREISIVNSVCAPLMERLCYRECATPVIEPGFIEKHYYLLHQKVIGEIQLQYQWRKKD